MRAVSTEEMLPAATGDSSKLPKSYDDVATKSLQSCHTVLQSSYGVTTNLLRSCCAVSAKPGTALYYEVATKLLRSGYELLLSC